MSDFGPYQAYIIRGWYEEDENQRSGTWRFRLQNVRAGDERGFNSLDALTSFLRETFPQGGPENDQK